MADTMRSPEPEPLSSKRAKLTCQINDLADKDLLSIFKHLLPYERLLTSEVCKRWYGISRIPWRDVVSINLGPIPGNKIGVIIQRCPNLRKLFAAGKTFAVGELHVLSRTSLSSLKLYGCSCDIPELEGESFDIFSAMFSGAIFSRPLRSASWEELVLLNSKASAKASKSYKGQIVGSLPISLKRLQLSNLDIESENEADSVDEMDDGDDDLEDEPLILKNLGRLQNLTCLILSSLSEDCLIADALDQERLFRELKKLRNLRELCLDFTVRRDETPSENAAGAVFSLPHLEVLFLHNVAYEGPDCVRLATKNPTLRILVMSGEFDVDVTIPARRLYPNGFAAPPVPLLHIFVGRRASEKIQFTKSPTDTLKIYPITSALPDFLEKEEIAPIFDGVWIAAQIKEGAKFGQKLWKYYGDSVTSFRLVGDA